MQDETATYELFYWPTLPGRGELVRLVLEDRSLTYEDVARRPEQDGGGFPSILEFVQGKNAGNPVFAPPILRHGHFVLAQTPVILEYLGRRHGLWPEGQASYQAAQLNLSFADFWTEIHDTHHPLIHSGWFEDQADAAKVRATNFRQARLPRFLGHFEDVLKVNGTGYMTGEAISVLDFVLFQTLEGLEYAFPNAMGQLRPEIPELLGLRQRVRTRPTLQAYLESPRRLAFNETGIFRRYDQLDSAPNAGPS